MSENINPRGGDACFMLTLTHDVIYEGAQLHNGNGHPGVHFIRLKCRLGPFKCKFQYLKCQIMGVYNNSFLGFKRIFREVQTPILVIKSHILAF